MVCTTCTHTDRAHVHRTMTIEHLMHVQYGQLVPLYTVA